jgi:DNA-binding response OmpR family regulator
VLDLRLPDGFGLALCRELRAAGSTVPILLLTALSQVALRVEGLDARADDFLAKRFAIAELRAPVRALGRRGALPRGKTYVRAGRLVRLAPQRLLRVPTLLVYAAGQRLARRAAAAFRDLALQAASPPRRTATSSHV